MVQNEAAAISQHKDKLHSNDFKAPKNAKMINLYVQLPGETVSELVRDYMAPVHQLKAVAKDSLLEHLNLAMNPTSLLKDQ